MIQESSKLRRLIVSVASGDKRQSLADLLYYNDLSIKDKISEKMILLKMFKFKNA